MRHRRVRGRHRAPDVPRVRLIAVTALVAFTASSGVAAASPVREVSRDALSAWVPSATRSDTPRVSATRTVQTLTRPEIRAQTPKVIAPHENSWDWQEFAAVAKQFEDESGYTATHHSR